MCLPRLFLAYAIQRHTFEWAGEIRRIGQNLYFTSSNTTFIDYQCVSIGCCIYVAKSNISIDNQHVTKSSQRYTIPSEQPKENTKKTLFVSHFAFGLRQISVTIGTFGSQLNQSVFIFSCATMMASLQRSRSDSSSTASMNLSANHKVSISFSS